MGSAVKYTEIPVEEQAGRRPEKVSGMRMRKQEQARRALTCRQLAHQCAAASIPAEQCNSSSGMPWFGDYPKMAGLSR